MIGDPSIFKLIRKAAVLARVLTDFVPKVRKEHRVLKVKESSTGRLPRMNS